MTSGADKRWNIAAIGEFERLAPQWNRIAEAAGYPPFLRAEFVGAALRTFGTGDEVLAVLGSDPHPIAMAILTKRRAAMWETFQPSQLPLGAFVRDGDHSLADVTETLFRALPGIVAVVSITQQDPAVVSRPESASLVRTLDYVETARLVIEGGFDAYWAARGKNLRHNVRRQLAKLAEEGATVRLDAIRDAADVAAAIADYGRLESAGWKAAEGTAVGMDNAQGRFYTRVFETFCAMGKGAIYRYAVNGNVAAMDLCIEDAGVVVVLKTAYDEALKTVSPATLMRHAYFRTLFDSRSVKRIEFYGKVMEWHRRWSEDIRMLYHVNLYRAPWVRKAADWVRRDETPQGAPG